MGIDRLNAAAWAAGFALAPTEDDSYQSSVVDTSPAMATGAASRWRSAKVPAAASRALAVATAESGGMRQWIAGWQRKATA